MFNFFLPQFNFVGRVIGPRGMTLREVELATGCKLLVRGRGSMKDKKLVMTLYINNFTRSLSSLCFSRNCCGCISEGAIFS